MTYAIIYFMKNLMLYIHIPFCIKKCNYCDFISFSANEDTIKKYVEQLICEIENKKHLGYDYQISSIYFGGGTPSYIDSKYIKYIIGSINAYYNLSDNCEISIEVNPNSASINKLSDYYNCGINRLSIGLQSTNDNELKLLGRSHNYHDFLDVFTNASHVGFKNINVDIINGIPEQTPDSYKKTLKQVLMLHINHISIYNLIIEPGTPFYEKYNDNKLPLPNETDLLAMDDITEELTNYYRLNRYEISNYAKEGFECKHNIGYWSLTPYLGFGLNSSSFYNNIRFKNPSSLNEYMSLKFNDYYINDNKSNFYKDITRLDKIDLINDYVMLGFRKTSGISKIDFFDIFNENFENLFLGKLEKYIDIGLIKCENNYYHFTKKGFNISNSILSDLLLEKT